MAIQLVMDGLKLQPCGPGFTDVRDAILLADEINYNGVNQCLIWNAFARRGLGFSADQGNSSSRADGTEAFDLPSNLRIDETISVNEAFEGEVLNISTSVTCGCSDKSSVEFKHLLSDGISVISVSTGSIDGNEISNSASLLTANSTLDIEYEARIDLCNSASGSILAQEGAEGENDFSSSTINNSGNWITSTAEANSGNASWYAEDFSVASDYGLSLVTPITVSGTTLLEFYHKYETQAAFDGGVVEVFSGGTWSDLGDEFLMNGYPSSFAFNGPSGLGGRDAFTGNSSVQLGSGFVKSIIDLSSYDGQTINIRFRFATNKNINSSGLNGWYIDDIMIGQISELNISASVTSSIGAEDADNYNIELNKLDQSTIFVDNASSGARYGGDWNNAFLSVRDALQLAECNPTVAEIWVKSGEYLPTESTDQNISFQLVDDVSIYGGFNGTESQLSERNVTANPTVLSGNIANSGVETDNSNHVVVSQNNTNTSLIDGFTIQGGNVSGNNGGGMLCNSSAVVINNCTFSNNYSSENGGALSMENGSNPTINDCSFNNNSAGMKGGAIAISGNSSATITNCQLGANVSSTNLGRAIHNFNSSLILENVQIIDPLVETSGNTINIEGMNMNGSITTKGIVEIKEN
jgi:predicted outer membrane repeat protein